MTAKVGRSQWDSYLINQYRQERDDARAENERLRAELIGEENLLRQNVEAVELAEQLQAELEQAYTKLRAALVVVGMIGFYWRDSEFPGEDGYFCPICDCEEPVHAPDCLKELVLAMNPVEVGEK